MQKIRPDMDIGKNIQTIRYANKLTQDQVIAKLNSCYIALSYSLRFSPTNPIVLFWYIFCLTFTTDCIPNPV